MVSEPEKTAEQIELDRNAPETANQSPLPASELALLSLLKRGRFGWLYLLVFNVVAQLVEPRVNLLTGWSLIWLANIVFSAVRVFLIVRMGRPAGLTPHNIRVWGWVSPLHALVVSGAVCEWYLTFGFDAQGLLASLVISGITLSTLVTNRPNLRILNRVVLAFLVPLIVTALWIGGPAGWGVGLHLVAILAFCLYQGRVENLEFWEALHAMRDVRVATQRIERAAQVHGDLMAARSRQSVLAAERSRIAGEWHDTLLAGFSAIAWQIDTARSELPNQVQQAAKALDVARAMLKHYRAEARLVVADLQIPSDDPDFKSAITRALEPLVGGRPVKLELELNGRGPVLPSSKQHQLIRICQEAVSNALQHAAPKSIAVKIASSDSLVKVEIRDDGAGFQVGDQLAGHYGLEIMQERARRIGGNFSIRSKPGSGTQVQVEIPSITDPEELKARVLIVESRRHDPPTPLQSILKSKTNVNIVDFASTGSSAIESFRLHLPDVTVVGPSLPDMSGLELRKAIHSVDPFAKVLVLSGVDLAETAKKSQLFAAVDAILARPPQTLDLRASAVQQPSPKVNLSRRERDVLEQLVEGLSNRDIATCLGIGEKVIDLCTHQIIEKLGASNTAHAIEIALRSGIVEPPPNSSGFLLAN